MKIGIISDLHMDFAAWDFNPEPDVHYLCAGDISSYKQHRWDFYEKHKGYLTGIRGNHDFYHDNFQIEDSMFMAKLGNLEVACATLWTDLKNPMDWLFYRNNLNDRRLTNYMSHEAYIAAHETQKEFVFNSGADIIMTHHAPTKLSVHERYVGHPINVCFVNDFRDRIEAMEKPPKLWIHGHTHDAMDYMVGLTRVICHPRGYPHEAHHKGYQPLIIDV